MVKKTLGFLWTNRIQVFRYLIVGGSGFIIDILVLFVIKQLFGSATWGVVCSQAVVVVYNFLLNKYWSFQSAQGGPKQFIKYIFVVAMNYSTGVLAMYFFHDVLGYHYIAIRVLTVVSFVPINFFLYKYWIYKVHSEIVQHE